ncbi:MAG: nucleotidyl transferase AbiEii/AbiGii toxin family protein [Candidatus Rokubacteria bacterium]|nr:nucleotidyl transferase AbiEii/AbiGii toxin family protein [Candidatus Rokubacteria bacterium]
MSRLDSILRRAARDLGDLGRQWALVGALAVSARSEPRFTRDVDVVVAVTSDDDAERVVRGLQARAYRLDAIVEQAATRRRLATARLSPPEETGVVLDALFASSGIEPEIAREADALEILAGLRVPVATTGHLIALKILARDDRTRPQDRVDLVALAAAAGPADIEQARAALALIAQRGFHRGKNLVADLEEFLETQHPARP